MSSPPIDSLSKFPIDRLPKWAQEHINTLQRQRDTAVQALQAWSDAQTEQPISVSEAECIAPGSPVLFTRYIEGRHLTIKWEGVELNVYLRTAGSINNSGIDLQWNDLKRHGSHVAMVPTSFQSVSLIAQDRLR